MLLLLVATAAALLGVQFVLLNWRNPAYWPASSLAVEHVQVAIRNLPADLSGFRIVQLSDIHYHDQLDNRTLAMLRDAVQRSNHWQPDLVLITGDLVDRAAAPARGLARLLDPLRARCGVYASLGNHDYLENAELVTDAMEAVGVHVLANKSTFVLPDEDRRLALVGLGDLWYDYRPEVAFAGLTDDVVRVVMSHNPDTAPSLDAVRADLILAGHTHGGQICLPNPFGERNRGWPVLRLIRAVVDGLPRALQPLKEMIPGLHYTRAVKRWEYAQGLHRLKTGNQLYVSRGLKDIYRRLFCEPEVTFITLVPA